MDPSTRRHAPSAPLAVLALCLTGCGAFEPEEPRTACPGAPAEAPVSASVPDTVAGGRTYLAEARFTSYPCVESRTDCGWRESDWMPVPIWSCETSSVQASCTPDLRLIDGPPGAATTLTQVRWPTARSDEGRVVHFEVEPVYPDGCGRPRFAWTATVGAGPPYPVIHALTLDRDVLRPGDTITVVADFEHGTASWNYGPLERGVPATSPPITDGGGSLYLRVTGELGEVVEESRRYQVFRPPVIHAFSATPERFVGGATAWLTWSVSDASSLELTPAAPIEPHQAYVQVTATTTFRLTARNPFGESAAAEVTVTRVPTPEIGSFTATPAVVQVGQAPVLLATFSGGTATLAALRGEVAYPLPPPEPLGVVESGVPFTAPPQRGFDRYQLVVSGELGQRVERTVEVPVAGPGSFATLPGNPRYRTSAPALTTLLDGRVVAAGGDPGLFGSTFELLDPVAGTARYAGVLPNEVASATTMSDGRVLFSGWSRYEIYPGLGYPDPIQRWDPTGADPGTVMRGDTSLYGVRVLALDGTTALAYGRGLSAAVTALIDVATSLVSPATLPGGLGSLSDPACRLADGRVLASGGSALYDPVSNAVSAALAPLPSGVIFLTCLADGAALRVGGQIERFDPATVTWTVLATAPERTGAGAQLDDGRVLLVTPSDGWLLDPVTGELTQAGRLANLRDPGGWRTDLRAAPCDGGRAVVHGAGGWPPELFTP